MQFPTNFFECNIRAIIVFFGIVIIALSVLCIHYAGKNKSDKLAIFGYILLPFGLAISIKGIGTEPDDCEYKEKIKK